MSGPPRVSDALGMATELARSSQILRSTKMWPQKPEFDFGDKERDDDEMQRARVLRAKAANIAREATNDPGDGLEL